MFLTSSGKRAAMGLVILGAVAVIGCGSDQTAEKGRNGPNSADNPADPAAAAPQWSSAQEVLAGAPDTPLTPMEIEWQGDTFVIDVPEGTKLEASTNKDAVLTAILPQQHLIEFVTGHWDMDERQQFLPRIGNGRALFRDNELMVVDWQLDKELRYDGFLTVNLGYRSFRVRFDNKGGSYNDYFTLPQIQLMLKCARTMRLKEAYPDDPVAVLTRLGYKFKPETQNAAEITSLSLGDYSDGYVVPGQLTLLPKLPKLEQLSLEATWLNPGDLGPLAECRQLKRLRVSSGGSLGDVDLQTIGKCTALERLEFPAGEATPAGIAALKSLMNLNTLDLGNLDAAALAGLAALDTLQALEVLEFAIDTSADKLKTYQTNGQLDALAKLSALKKLKLRAPLKDADMASIGKLKQIENLELDGLFISDAGLAPLGQLAALKRLTLGATFIDDEQVRITGKGVASLASLGALEELRIGGFRVPDENIPNWQQLKQLPKLKQVRFEGSTRITKEGLAKLKEAMPDVSIF